MILNRLWGWVAAGFGLLLAVLLFVMGQRDKAKQKTVEVKRKLNVEKINREAEQDISSAVKKAREASEETKREHQERPVGTRPSGSFRRK